MKRKRRIIQFRVMYSATVFATVSCVLIVAALVLKGGIFHGTSTERDFYRDVLGQVVFDQYYLRCNTATDTEADRLFEIYKTRVVPNPTLAQRAALLRASHAFSRRVDAVKRRRLTESPKCSLYYKQEFTPITWDVDDRSMRNAFIHTIRKEALLNEGWEDAPLEPISDSLIRPASLKSEDLNIDYLDIRSAQPREHLSDRGLGVFTFSKAFFNKDRDRAIVYYEMICGGFCGEGQILVVQKKMGRWYVTRYVQQMKI